jgi:hypothetical protein
LNTQDTYLTYLSFEAGLELVTIAFERHAPDPPLPITLQDPWENLRSTETGTKPEHGPGGFEFRTPIAGLYLLLIGGHTYQVPVLKGHRTLIVLWSPQERWDRLLSKLDQLIALITPANEKETHDD